MVCMPGSNNNAGHYYTLNTKYVKLFCWDAFRQGNEQGKSKRAEFGEIGHFNFSLMEQAREISLLGVSENEYSDTNFKQYV